MSAADPLLEVENLKVIFHGDRGRITHAVDSLDLTVQTPRVDQRNDGLTLQQGHRVDAGDEVREIS